MPKKPRNTHLRDVTTKNISRLDWRSWASPRIHGEANLRPSKWDRRACRCTKMWIQEWPATLRNLRNTTTTKSKRDDSQLANVETAKIACEQWSSKRPINLHDSNRMRNNQCPKSLGLDHTENYHAHISWVFLLQAKPQMLSKPPCHANKWFK